jgi:sterol desaturase/sphingolipid hydroxylase (fatty acid hydroxylase superfamily)
MVSVIIVLGVDTQILLTCFALKVFFGLFQCMNLQLPKMIDTIMGYVFITPSQKRVHHAMTQNKTKMFYNETDAKNYGAVFSFWDRLFHTAMEGVKYGRTGLGDKKQPTQPDNIVYLLLLPFMSARVQDEILWADHRNFRNRRLFRFSPNRRT